MRECTLLSWTARREERRAAKTYKALVSFGRAQEKLFVLPMAKSEKGKRKNPYLQAVWNF